LEAADENKDGVISVSEIEKFLSNIGAADQLSTTEIHHVFAHLGIDEQSSIGIPLQKVKDMLIQTTK
jgi:Ca2+-binding EF-hand superfamily protein